MHAGLQVEIGKIFRYKNSQKETVVRDVRFHASPGSIIDITGPSGSGKTSILLALNRLVPFEGVLCINGTSHSSFEPCRWREAVSFLPARIQPASQSIYDFLLFPFSFRVHKHKKIPSREHIISMLNTLACPLPLDQDIREVSLGQQYRLNFLRILLLKPSVYLLDEPFANLDPKNVKRVQALLDQERQKGRIIIRGMHTISQYPADQAFFLGNNIFRKGTG